MINIPPIESIDDNLSVSVCINIPNFSKYKKKEVDIPPA